MSNNILKIAGLTSVAYVNVALAGNSGGKIWEHGEKMVEAYKKGKLDSAIGHLLGAVGNATLVYAFATSNKKISDRISELSNGSKD